MLIFAGTTEGRVLAEFCVQNGIPADVSSATAYGASLLPAGVGVYEGRMDAGDIATLLRFGRYALVVDATHPYAVEVSENIRAACGETGTPLKRLLRERVPVFGETADSLGEIIGILNRTAENVLSTLGSKSVRELTRVQGYAERLFLRILPENAAECTALGFPPEHLICARGPFTTEQNLVHIRQSGAEILLTKESGKTGGYPEKIEAVKQCGIRMITLVRPAESGYSPEELQAFLLEERRCGRL